MQIMDKISKHEKEILKSILEENKLNYDSILYRYTSEKYLKKNEDGRETLVANYEPIEMVIDTYKGQGHVYIAKDIVYQDVARALLGGWHGVEGSLPATINAGETRSFDFTITLSEDWDINHLEIVGMLIDNASGKIENATKDEALITGVPQMDANSIVIYPNPAIDEVVISIIDPGDIYIYNLNGQLVLEKQNVKAATKLDISNFENGTYIVKVISDTNIMTAKLNIVK